MSGHRCSRCFNLIKPSEELCYIHKHTANLKSGEGVRMQRLPSSHPALAQPKHPTLFGDDEEDAHQEFLSDSPKGYEGRKDTMPRYAFFRGRKARVISYEGDGRFLILDSNDQQRTVLRQSIEFVAEKGTSES